MFLLFNSLLIQYVYELICSFSRLSQSGGKSRNYFRLCKKNLSFFLENFYSCILPAFLLETDGKNTTFSIYNPNLFLLIFLVLTNLYMNVISVLRVQR